MEEKTNLTDHHWTSAERTSADLCIVRELIKALIAPDGTQLLTEFDCPLFQLTSKLFIASTLSIVSPIHCIYDTCLHSVLLYHRTTLDS